MRFSSPSTLIGSLGALLQQVVAGVNALVVQCYGSLGQLAQQLIGGVNSLAVVERGSPYGLAVNVGSLTINTAVAVVAAASNINGVIIWNAQIVSNMAGLGIVTLLCKTSAPVNFQDGDVVQTLQVRTANVPENGPMLARPIVVPAGKGVYWISNTTESGGLKSALVTIL